MDARLYESDLGTALTWQWNVAKTAAWMNASKGLSRELGCALLAAG